MKLMLDLFSGLGGASEAFVQSPDWEVIRIDNNELLADVPFTIMGDLTKQHPTRMKPDLIWASPPCTDFSLAYSAPRAVAAREGREFEPDLAPLMAAMEIIADLQPINWVIENVVGASKIFSEKIGISHRQKVGPFMRWGNFPLLELDDFRHKKDKNPDGSSKDRHSSDPLRANVRGMVPIEISQALLEAVETPTLEDFA